MSRGPSVARPALIGEVQMAIRNGLSQLSLWSKDPEGCEVIIDAESICRSTCWWDCRNTCPPER